MVTAKYVIGAGRRMEKGEHQTTGLQHHMDAREDRCKKRLRQVVDCIPEDDNIEFATGEVEVALEEALHIEPRLFARLAGSEPLRLGCFLHDVRHVDAMAEACDVVDVG